MNIYLVERTDEVDYDEYDSAVVYAKDEEAAKVLVHREIFCNDPPVTVTLVGSSDIESEGIILSSFNAG